MLSCGSKGIPQSGLKFRMNIGKLEARMICRRLEKEGVIKVRPTQTLSSFCSCSPHFQFSQFDFGMRSFGSCKQRLLRFHWERERIVGNLVFNFVRAVPYINYFKYRPVNLVRVTCLLSLQGFMEDEGRQRTTKFISHKCVFMNISKVFLRGCSIYEFGLSQVCKWEWSTAALR